MSHGLDEDGNRKGEAPKKSKEQILSEFDDLNADYLESKHGKS